MPVVSDWGVKIVPEVQESWLRIKGRLLPLDGRVLIMGILNVTPDSFSDGGRYFDPAKAVERGLTLQEEGADLLDIGAESSRPGAETVGETEELKRLEPVLKALGRRLSIPISVDTTKSAVAKMALSYGAAMINDVSALRDDPDMAKTVAQAEAGVVLMHRKGTAQTMQHECCYDNVVSEVRQFLQERMLVARAAGIQPDAIVIDPGIGFGKNLQQNLDLLAHVRSLTELGSPVLVGVSRKTVIGHIVKKDIGDRLMGTAAAVAAAVLQGAELVRVHDVAPMRDVVAMAQAIRDAGTKDDGSGRGYA